MAPVRIALLLLALIAPASADSARSTEALHAAINAAREVHSLAPLDLDDRLMRAASRHADDMVARRFFDHRSPEGDGVADRVAETGYAYRRVGETLALGMPSPESVVDSWRSSQGHADILFAPEFDAVGLAYHAGPLHYRGKDIRHVWVAVFARHR